MIMFMANVRFFGVLQGKNASVAGNKLYLCLESMLLSSTLGFSHLFLFAIEQWPSFEEVIFQQGLPLELPSNGGLWLSSENQTKAGMLMRPPSLPRDLFFALLHPRNLLEGPSVVQAFSNSLDVCGMNPAVAKAFKHLSFTPSVSVHTCTYLN